jgi:single-strand DNA-binding protein
MKNVNKVFLLGNVSREPEIKKTTSGKKVAIFGIATNRDWVMQDNKEKQSLTEFHNCVAWGRLADLCEMYLTKGKLVYAEGYLKTRSWEDEYGRRQFRTEVVLMEIIILEKFSRKDMEEGMTLSQDSDEAIDHDFHFEDDDILNTDFSDKDNKKSAHMSDALFEEEQK